MLAQNTTNKVRAINAAIYRDGKQLSPEGIAICKQMLSQQGSCLLENLSDNFDTIGFLQNFSSPIAQHNGEFVYSVKAAPGFEKHSDSKSTNRLKPHTDGSDCDPPPRWLALWGVQPARCGGGHTQLADCDRFIKSLDIATRQEVETRIYQFKSSSQGIHAKRIHAVKSSLLSKLSGADRPIFRFSENLLLHGDYSPALDETRVEADAFTQDFCDRLLQFFQEFSTSILIQPNSLLLWDNWRMVHSRTQYRDRERHLLRYWLS